jgi:transcription initiation factor TFIIB
MSSKPKQEIFSSDDGDWDRFDQVTSERKKVDKKLCISCKSTNIISDYSKGCMRCDNCGTCFGQILDNGADWSTYDDGTNTEVARCGHVTSHFFPKSSMRTSTACGKNPSLKLIGRNDQMPYEEYALLDIFNIITNICLVNRLSKAVIENTKLLYFEIHKRKIIIRGHSNKNGMYAACTFYGAHIQHCYRSIEECATMYHVKDADVTSMCNKLQKILINHPILNSLTPTSPLDFIDRFCYILGFEKCQIFDIRRIVRNNGRLYLTSNHQPMSIAASCVLIYMNIYEINMPNKRQVLETFHITAVTSDKIFNKIFPFRKVIVDDEISDMVLKKFEESNFIAVSSTLQQDLDNDVSRLRQELYDQNKEALDFEAQNKDLYIQITNDIYKPKKVGRPATKSQKIMKKIDQIIAKGAPKYTIERSSKSSVESV